MCNETVLVKVHGGWKAYIDSCIADIVGALEDNGIQANGSCCGHGEDFGVIVLQDGRMLMICDKSDYRSFRWAILAAWQIVRNAVRRYLLEGEK